MMEQSLAAIEEMTNVAVRLDPIKGLAESMIEHAGEIGHDTIVGAATAVVDACDEALEHLGRESVTTVAHAVQNAGGVT